MAVEAVVALMVVKLDELVRKDARLLGVHREINWIREQLNQMQRFLKDADIKQKEDEDVRDWMEDIRDICFDVDDVIDILGQGQAAQGRHGFVESLKRCISDQITRYKAGKEIERIKLNIKGISRSRESYGIRETSSTQRFQEVSRCSVQPEKIEKAITTVGDQLTNEERTRDIDEGRQEASSSTRNLQAHRRVSTLPGEPEEVGLQEEINTVGQQLIEEEPRPHDGTRDIDEGKLEASSSTPGLQADGQFSTPLGESEEVGLQEEINRVSEELMKEEPSPCDGTRDIDEGRQEARPSNRSLQDRPQFSAVLAGSEIVGQQEEINALKEQLINGEPGLRMISIVGRSGSGKTTLATKVYQDVKNDFDRHAFICLSQRFGFKDTLRHIIKNCLYVNYGDREDMDVWELRRILSYHLRGENYLVVIDHIWSIEAWDAIEFMFRDGTSKSRVILIARNKEVVADLLSHPHVTHGMRLLNDDEGWELFMKKIFPGGDPSTSCPSNLVETGRKILKKCAGLPLAILVLGGLLARKDKTERAWSKVLESIPESSKQCMDILALSYRDLPLYLKPCFLYFGLFPEDYEISSTKLIRLWIAEGFIQLEGNRVMEDAAEDYLEELVSRSMIQVASRRSNGSIHKCRIHDLLRELSISEATKKKFFTVYNENYTSSSSTSVRRLAVYRNIDGDETKTHSIENLRSIFYFSDSKVDVLKLPNTSRKLLKVMNAESEKVSEVSLPKEVGKFVHLKFLEFSRKYRFHSIPPSIGNLSSLQTLKVLHSEADLPNTIWKLKELRHLHAYSHIKGHPHLINLSNLQTLHLSAGSWIEEGLGKLTNLRKLKISGDVSSYHDTLPNCIEKLRNLRSLKLTSWRPIPPLMPFTHHLELYKIYLCGSIKKLPELPPNLVELNLVGSELKQDVIPTLEKLKHLKILKLSESYLSKQMICSPGGFPQLELLVLHQLPLEEWIVHEDAMISLKCVKLDDMYALKTETLPERVLAVLVEQDSEEELVEFSTEEPVEELNFEEELVEFSKEELVEELNFEEELS